MSNQGQTSPEVKEQTILLYAPGKKIYAREIKGTFNRLRWVMVAITQLLYYGLPWCSIWWSGSFTSLAWCFGRKTLSI